jgi:hypothetical protein
MTNVSYPITDHFVVNLRHHGTVDPEPDPALNFNVTPFAAMSGGPFTVTITSASAVTTEHMITVAGVASLNINWTAQIQTAEGATATTPENVVRVVGTAGNTFTISGAGYIRHRGTAATNVGTALDYTMGNGVIINSNSNHVALQSSWVTGSARQNGAIRATGPVEVRVHNGTVEALGAGIAINVYGTTTGRVVIGSGTTNSSPTVSAVSGVTILSASTHVGSNYMPDAADISAVTVLSGTVSVNGAGGVGIRTTGDDGIITVANGANLAGTVEATHAGARAIDALGNVNVLSVSGSHRGTVRSTNGTSALGAAIASSTGNVTVNGGSVTSGGSQAVTVRAASVNVGISANASRIVGSIAATGTAPVAVVTTGGDVNISGESITSTGRAIESGGIVNVGSTTTGSPIRRGVVTGGTGSAIVAVGDVSLDNAVDITSGITTTGATIETAGNVDIVTGNVTMNISNTGSADSSVAVIRAPSGTVEIDEANVNITASGNASAIVADNVIIQTKDNMDNPATIGRFDIRIRTASGGNGRAIDAVGDVIVNARQAIITAGLGSAIRAGGDINIIQSEEIMNVGGTHATDAGVAMRGAAIVTLNGDFNVTGVSSLVSNNGTVVWLNGGTKTVTLGNNTGIGNTPSINANTTNSANPFLAAVLSAGNVIMHQGVTIDARTAAGIRSIGDATVTVNSGRITSANNSAIDVANGNVKIGGVTAAAVLSVSAALTAPVLVSRGALPVVNVSVGGSVVVDVGEIRNEGSGHGIQVVGDVPVTVETKNVTGLATDRITINTVNGTGVVAVDGTVLVNGLHKQGVSIDATGTTGNGISTRRGNVTVKDASVSVSSASAQTASAAIVTNAGNAGVGFGNVTVNTSGLPTGTPPAGKVTTVSVGGNASAIRTLGANSAVNVSTGAGFTRVDITGVAGRTIDAAGPVTVGDMTTVSATSGVAIAGDVVTVGMSLTPATLIAPHTAVVTVNGSGTSVGTGTAAGIAILARRANVNRGALISAGTEGSGADAGAGGPVGVAIRTTDTSTTSDGVVVNGGIIRAYGAGHAISALTAANVSVAPAATTPTRIWAGNGGRAIDLARGNVRVAGGTVEVLGDGAGGTAIAAGGDVAIEGGRIRANAGGTAISATATSGNRKVIVNAAGSAPADTLIFVGEGGTGIASAAGVIDTVRAGRIMVGLGGTGIAAANRVVLVGGVVEVLDSAGTAIRMTGTTPTTGVLTISGGEIRSNDVAIAATQAVSVVGNLTLSGRIDADMFVHQTVEAENADGKLVVGTTRVNTGARAAVGANRTLSVGRRGTIEIGSNDTLVVAGTLNTITAGTGTPIAKVVTNKGRLVIGATGNLNYIRPVTAESDLSYVNEGVTVLSAGSQVNGRTLVRTAADSTVTFLRQARVLSAGTGSSVIVPPVLSLSTQSDQATPASSWTNGAASDSVFTVVGRVFPKDTTYRAYEGAVTFKSVSGTLPTGFSFRNDGSIDSANVSIDSATGTLDGLLTEAGSFRFGVQAENEAGRSDILEYTLTVHRVGMRLNAYVAGFVDAISISQQVPYTGNPVPVSLRGRAVNGTFEQFARYTGFHPNPTVVYVSANPERPYGPTSVPPTEVGVYNVRVTYGQGLNFNGMGAAADSLGHTLTIVPVSLDEYLGGANLSTINHFVLDGVANARVAVALPKLPIGASYGTITPGPDWFLEKEGLEAPFATIVRDSLVFGITDESDLRDRSLISFRIDVANGDNLSGSNAVTVNVRAVSEDLLIEPTPNVSVRFVQETLTGFAQGRPFEVKVDGEVVASTIMDGTDVPIAADWFGKDVSIVALPSAEFMIQSAAQAFTLSARPAAPAGLSGDTLRIVGTTAAMEFRRAGTTMWTPATSEATVVTVGGDYEVRLRAVAVDSVFASAVATVEVIGAVSIAGSDRDIPNNNVHFEEAVIAPVTRLEATLTVGPSPASKSAGNVGIFWQGGAVASGTLFVFDANGNMVNRISVGADNASNSERRQIAGWNLADRRGRQVSEGTYVVRGTLTLKDGGKAAVSTVFGVAQ